MTSSQQGTTPCQWFSYLASALDRRSSPRLVWLFVGAVLARGRRTVTSWIRAAGLSRKFQPCYTTVAAAGKQADNVSARLVNEAVRAAGRRPGADHPGPRRHADGGLRGVSSRVAGKHCCFPAPSELDVRVAPHPAQALTSAPRGTRPLSSVFLAHGSAYGSRRATTPSCRP